MVQTKKANLAKLFLTGLSVFISLFSFSQSVSTYWQYNRPGPVGYDITDMCYVSNTVGYTCGTAGVISRTTDGGRTWVHDYLPGKPGLTAILFPSEKVGYVVTSNGKIAKTVNRGITWSFITSPTTASINNLYFFDENNGFIVADPSGGAAGIFKTTNGGTSWTSVASAYPVQNRSIKAIAFYNANVGYTCGASGHAAKTTDGGLTWTNITMVAGNPATPPGAGNPVTQSYVSIAVIDAQTVLVGSQNNTNIVKTIDGGTTWVSKVAQAGTPTTLAGSQPMYNMASAGNDVVITAGAYCGASHDAGETWTFKRPFINTGSLAGILQYAITYTPNKTVKIAGAYGSMADSVSGAAFWDTAFYKNLVYNPGGFRSFLGVSALDQNRIIAGGNRGILFRTADGGKTWDDKTILEFQLPLATVEVDIKDVKYVATDAMYMCAGNGYVYRSFNGGDTWPINPGDPYSYSPGGGASMLNMDFIDKNTGWVCGGNFVSGGAFIYRTVDGGLNWTKQTTTLTGTTFIYSVDFVNATTGWASGNGGKVYKTTDGGVNWTLQTVPATVTANLFSINFVATADTGWAVGLGKIIHTTDGGATWAEQTPPVVTPFNKVSVINGNVAIVFGNNGNCFKTIDGGATWTDFTAPTFDALMSATFAAPYNSVNPGVDLSDVDMFVVGGKFAGPQSPTMMNAKIFYQAPAPAAPVITNVADRCIASPTSKGKILNPPAYTQISITVDGEEVLYSPEDSSFIYYESGITPAGSHTVTVTFTNTGGVVSNSVTYTFYATNSTPSVTIASNDADNIICEGQPVTFTATPVNGGTAPAYQWKVNGSNQGTNANTFTYVPANGDVVTVVLTSNFPCVTTATATSNAITSTVPQFTPVIYMSAGNELSLQSTAAAGSTFQWMKDGQPVAGATATSLTITQFGAYSLMQTLNTCTKTSNVIVMGPGSGNDRITLFPVPATTVVNARINAAGNSITAASVYTSTGALVIKKQFASNQQLVSIDISALPAGVYLVRFETTGGTIAGKFVK